MKWVGVIMMLAGLAAGAAELTGNAKTGAAGAGRPKLEFDEPFFDFGRLQSGKVVTHDFIFTNAGNAPLEITEVNSSCGCTAVTNWDRRVEPGKTGKLHVLFNSGGLAGAVRKYLRIVSNDPEPTVASLEISATIWKLIDAIPSVATFAFGPDFQTNETRVIRLFSNLPEPVTLSAPVCTNRFFRAELKTLQPGKEFELHVTVVPPLGPGSQVASITMKTSSPQIPEVAVTAYGLVQPALTLTPPRILLPVPLEEGRQFVIAIRNNGSQPVTLSDPGINAKGVSVQLREIQPGRRFDLMVTFPAGFRQEAGRHIEAHVKSNHPQSPEIIVPVTELEPDTG